MSCKVARKGVQFPREYEFNKVLELQGNRFGKTDWNWVFKMLAMSVYANSL